MKFEFFSLSLSLSHCHIKSQIVLLPVCLFSVSLSLFLASQLSVYFELVLR